MDLEEKLIILGYQEIDQMDWSQGFNPNFKEYALYNNDKTKREVIWYDTMFKECGKYAQHSSYGGWATGEDLTMTDFERSSIFSGYKVRP